jgi:CelD/BcsL family acetyltransferase involved in cellulose biosynthesis
VITVVPGRSLSRDVAAKWRRLQASNASLASPYFCPEFTEAVASARNDVQVAIVEDQQGIAAIFPHHRRGRAGRPVGGILSDFQGITCGPEFQVNVEDLLRTCRLDAFDFDHMLASQPGFSVYAQNREASPRIDFSGGYAAYVTERKRAGSKQITKCENLMRRVEREVGQLSFVPHSSDAALLQKVLAWKSAQYSRTGHCDIFATAWIRRVVERIHATETQGFAGRLSLLYAGDVLIAGHLGMRTPSVWHYWFPAYDLSYSKYSPGLLLLLKIVEQAAAEGASYLDLGKGMCLYKERLMNTHIVLSQGWVELPSLLKWRRAIGRSLGSYARLAIFGSRLEAPARRLVHALRDR